MHQDLYLRPDRYLDTVTNARHADLKSPFPGDLEKSYYDAVHCPFSNYQLSSEAEIATCLHVQEMTTNKLVVYLSGKEACFFPNISFTFIYFLSEPFRERPLQNNGRHLKPCGVVCYAR